MSVLAWVLLVGLAAVCVSLVFLYCLFTLGAEPGHTINDYRSRVDQERVPMSMPSGRYRLEEKPRAHSPTRRAPARFAHGLFVHSADRRPREKCAMFDGAHIVCSEPRNIGPSVFERSFGRNKVALQVLIVDDNPGDIRLARETFRQARGSVQLHVAFDGVEAMAFLRTEGVHAGAPRPDLIMLDLNMPRMDGREVLAAMKADERLKLIPTVILTGSDGEAHLAKDYELNPKCYIVKPLHLDAFEVLISSVIDFWRTRERVSLSKWGMAQIE